MSTKLPPEVLECIAAHLLAVTWLADAIHKDDQLLRLVERDELVKRAQRKGLERYRRMTPMDIAAIAANALDNYRAIAGQLDSHTTEDMNP